MRNKTICILTSAHPIDDVRVYRKIAITLVKKFEITWIGPKVALFEKDIKDDNIFRILVKQRNGIFGRIATNYSILKKYRQLRNKFDFVYIPDPDMIFFFTRFVRSYRTKVIFDIHEVFHKELLHRRVKGIFYRVLRNFIIEIMKASVNKSNLTIGVSETVLQYYVTKRNKSLVIRNCLPVKYSEYSNLSVNKNLVFTLVHGKSHISRGTLKIFEALRILKEKGIFCKVLMINNSDVEEKLLAYYGDKYDIGSYFDLHNTLPFLTMISEMSLCHAGLITYGRDLGVDSLPNRIFEYMALGLPSIVPDYGIELANLVLEEKCGIVLDTENPVQIAKGIEYLLKNPLLCLDMGARGKKAFNERHNWEVEVEPLLYYLDSN